MIVEDNEMTQTIRQTEAYLQYVEEHYMNVQRAWALMKKKCSDHAFVTHDLSRKFLDEEVNRHDLSKLSKAEFTPFRRKFFPTSFDIDKGQIRQEFSLAWIHHQDHNHHHWQRWTKTDYTGAFSQKLHCVHMIVDWVAMGFKFENTARSYFELNHENILIPGWAVRFLYSVFSALEDKEIPIPFDFDD